MSAEEAARSIQVVLRLCEHWPTLSREDFRKLLADDCIYTDMPLPSQVAVGPDAAFKKLGVLRNDWVIENEIVNTVGNGRTVMVERVETGRSLAGIIEDWRVPCVGVFEIEGGKIKTWRDYWNFADVEPLMRLAAIGHSSGLDAATGFFYGAAVWVEVADRSASATTRR